MTSADDIAMWDAEADAFDEPVDHGLRDPVARDAWRTLLLDNLPKAPARIADLGCGTGTLSVLLGHESFVVDGVDFSPRMIELAERKGADQAGVRFHCADAYDPPLPQGVFDAVVCRHVLWAMPDPAIALKRWTRLLGLNGRLVLIEGRWSNGAGLPGEQTTRLVVDAGRQASLIPLTDHAYWGGAVTDDRYLLISPPHASGADA